MAEGVNAAATGALGIGLPTLMWTLDRLGVEIPKPVVLLMLAVSVILILISLGLWVHLIIRWLRSRRHPPETAPAVAAPSQRMPIVDFMALAGRQGWRVLGQHNLEALDLLEGLTQAAVDETIRFWGRFGAGALVSIEKDHWSEYRFDAISITRPSPQNALTRTQTFSQKDQRFVTGHSDLYLDGGAATRWLVTDALAFRGRHDQRGTSRG